MFKIEQYISIKKNFHEVLLEEKKSKFIGSIYKIDTEDDAKEILVSLRKKYSDANHNCYGFITLDGNIKRFSDDGEPQKTAGLPILDVIEKNNCVGVLIVVTRYFGGTLLGTGGLVKMYSSTAVLALNEAIISTFVPHCIYEIVIPYSSKPKIDNIFLNEGFEVVEEFYTDMVTMHLQILREKTTQLFEIMQDITSGQVTPTLISDNIMCC